MRDQTRKRQKLNVNQGLKQVVLVRTPEERQVGPSYGFNGPNIWVTTIGGTNGLLNTPT